MTDLAAAIMLGAGVIYTVTSKLMGQATFSQRIAELATVMPAIVAAWGVMGALALPGLRGWAWCAWSALLVHWFVPAPERTLPPQYGTPLVLALVAACYWLPGWVGLLAGGPVALFAFPRSEENWSITDSPEP